MNWRFLFKNVIIIFSFFIYYFMLYFFDFWLSFSWIYIEVLIVIKK